MVRKLLIPAILLLVLLAGCQQPLVQDPDFSTDFDLDPPDSSSLNGVAATTNTTPTWSWTSGGNGIGLFRYRINGGAWQETTGLSYTPASPLTEGIYLFEVSERDDRGNWSEPEQFRTAVDLTPPPPPVITATGTQAVDGSGNPIPNTTVTTETRPVWSWSPSGNGNGTFDLDTSGVDGGGPANPTTATSYQPAAALGGGSYTLTVLEWDAAGNQSAIASFTVIIDQSVPTLSLLDDSGSTGDGITNIDPPRWEVTSASGSLVTDSYRWRVDGAPWTSTTGTSPLVIQSTSGLGDGSHIFEVQQQKSDGTFSASASATVVIDTTAPLAPTISGIASGTYQDDQTFSVSGSAGGVLEYSTDGGATWSSYTSPVSLTTNGTYDVTARERDPAGNLSGDASIISVTIANTVPTVGGSVYSSVQATAAEVAGSVTDDGGDPVIDRGVVWNTTGSPTLADSSSSSSGTGLGNFTATLSGLTASTTYYVRAFATNAVGTAYGPEISFISGQADYGDTYLGGLAFYFDGAGGGLVAAPSDQSTGQGWGGLGIATGAVGTAIGTGQSNTTTIVSRILTGSAAGVADSLTLNGYSDWFLPSEDELAAMYTNLKAAGLGAFADAFYWASTEASANNARIIDFTDGTFSFAGKSGLNSVRAVRAF